MASSYKLFALAAVAATVLMASALPSDILKLSVAHKELEDYAPVNLTLYYQSICGACMDFITRALNHTWLTIGSSGILDVNLIPFGNAKMTKKGDKYNFTCQGGYAECEGNILETCIIHYEPKFEDHFPAVSCIEKYFLFHDEWKDILKNCSSHLRTNVTTIENCVEGDLGNQLEHEMGERTGPHRFVPWPLVNGVFDPPLHNDLTATICAAYKGPKPKGCPQ